MLIGVPKEIKVREYRVGLVPASVRELTAMGHEVVVETGAGAADALAAARAIANSPRSRKSRAPMEIESNPGFCRDFLRRRGAFRY